MLANVSMTTKLDEEIEYLHQNATNMTKQISEILKNKSYSVVYEMFHEQRDDFEPIVGGFVTKFILFVLYFVIVLILNTIFNTLLIHYERFGGDPMKRSLINQLIAQTGYAELLQNWVLPPIIIFRILIGPINHHLAAFSEAFHFSIITW